MLKLHQIESCPFCKKVRSFLQFHRIPFQAVPAAPLGEERHATLALPGISSMEVPVLEDGEVVVQGSDAIIAYLGEKLGQGRFGDPNWGFTRRFPGMSYEEAVQRTRAALATEGFGVLTEIDVQATMKEKLDVEFRPYVILGACNPSLAHRALSALPGIGLLLPCNLVVTVEDDAAVVSALNPRVAFQVVDLPGMDDLVKEVTAKVRRVMAALG